MAETRETSNAPHAPPEDDPLRRNPNPTVGGPAARIPLEQLITEPSGPPYVGEGAGPETKEAREEREARGDPPPRPLWGEASGGGSANKPLGYRPGEAQRAEEERHRAEAEKHRAEQAKTATRK